MNRRGFIRGLVSALAAPAVVRAELLMPISALHVPTDVGWIPLRFTEALCWTGIGDSELVALTRRVIVPRIVAQIERVPPVPSGFTLAGVPLYMDQPANKL